MWPVSASPGKVYYTTFVLPPGRVSRGGAKMVERRSIPVGKIRPSPFQARETFDKDLIEQLAESMKTVDLRQPIIVRPHKDGCQLAAGERRWRAGKDAGWDGDLAGGREGDDTAK